MVKESVNLLELLPATTTAFPTKRGSGNAADTADLEGVYSTKHQLLYARTRPPGRHGW